MPDGIMPWFYKTFAGIEEADYRAHQTYRERGGHLSLDAWMKQDRPSPPARVTERGKRILEPLGLLPPGMDLGPTPPGERVRAAQEAEGALGQVGLGVAVPPRPTEPAPSGFRWAFDRDLNRWIPQFAGLTAQQQAQQEFSQQQLEFQREQALPQPVTPYQQEQLELQRQRLQFEQRQALPQAVTPFQQRQFGLQEQQLAQGQAQFQQQLQFQQAQAQAAAEEQERQYRSQLAANPISWLQYAAYTGEQPVVQPWMVPLGFQNQGGDITPQGIQAGQPIPGFQATAGERDIQGFGNLPALTTPSAQLQARWGPTAQAQFLGYRRARTGAPPEETQFRLSSTRAPTGRFGGFSRFR